MKGQNVLEKEFDYAKSIPEDERVLVRVDHFDMDQEAM